jgi:hypothetical protein
MMRTKFYFLVLLVLSFVQFNFAQWVSLDNTSLPGSKAEVRVISDSPSETILKVNLPGFFIKNFTADGKEYQSINIGDEAIISETGSPELPYIAKVLAIPDNGMVEVEVLETGPVQKFEGIYVPPARESWIEGKPETPYVENAQRYSSDKLFPARATLVEDPAVFRDFRIARVSIFPIRYSPSRHELEAVSSITVRVKYLPGIGINPRTTPHHPIPRSFGKLYRSFLFNYQEVLQRDYNGLEAGDELMLCIMPDAFVNTFQIYADWKQKSGVKIIITKFSDIGANQNDPTIIKNYIQMAYENWVVPPTHILIVGDQGTAPVKFVTLQGWNFVNEDYFVELEGNDYFPELFIGRFTNQNDYTLQVLVYKFMNYERHPYVDDVSWYKRATVCSNNAYTSQVETKRFAAARMTEYGYTVDTLMSDGGWSGSGCTMTLADVIETINNGISYLNYRGEGWNDGWHANCYYFSTSSVSSLNNAQKLTFVTSIGCGVAMFNSGQCFGEEWLELGTPTAPRGACAFLGPTSNTHTYYNDAIDKGIYMGMFQEGINAPGEALVRGKLNMYNVFGGTDPFVEYHYKIYCALGDPSIHIWKNVPRQVSVTYPDTIPTGYSQVQVIVNGSTGRIGGARVCITGTDLFALGYTDPNGVALLDVNVSSQSEVALTVCGDVVYPFEATIQTEPADENIAPLTNPEIVDLDGNNDGLINPNENCTIAFTLKNWGNTTSYNVTATLLIPDTIDFVDITTPGPVSFGDIAVGDSVVGSPFQFYVHPECPVGFTIPFKLHVESQTASWDYYSMQPVHGCQLKYMEYQVDDSGNILHNHRMDPGETVNVSMKISNTGDDIAPQIMGILSCTDQYITIPDSIGTFGTLLPDSSVSNISNQFVVKVSENCPLQHEVNYILKLTTQNGQYPYSTSQTFIIPVAQPSHFDPTGPDQYGYYAYSSDDTLWQEAPQFDWIDITTIGTQINRPPNASDFTQTVTLPFTFKYYGNNFTQLRISSDGWIAFGSGTQVMHENFPLPNPDDINNMVAAFWDDLFSTASGETGKIYYYNDAANHRFIISWEQVGHFSDYTDQETFQIILLDPQFYSTATGDGKILIQYKIVEEPGSCTVGIENNTEDIGLTYLFDENYDITASQLQGDFAILFTTETPLIVSVHESETIKNIIPDKYILEQNYPNPFNPETHIRYELPEPGNVSLKIYKIDGELIKVLCDDYQSAGRYEKVWDGTNDHGTKVSSGVYFYRLSSVKFTQVRKMLFLK